MEEAQTPDLAVLYLQSVIKRFNEYKSLGEKTLAQLSETQLHVQPNKETNSAAMIIQHLHGNMRSRWINFLTEDGEKPWRERDAEFHVHPHLKEELLQLWHEGWAVVLETLNSLKPHDLLKNITIRSQLLNVVDAINRQLAHYGYHVGQLVYIGKMLLAENWQQLSVPRGGSQEYTAALQQRASDNR